MFGEGAFSMCPSNNLDLILEEVSETKCNHSPGISRTQFFGTFFLRLLLLPQLYTSMQLRYLFGSTFSIIRWGYVLLVP